MEERLGEMRKGRRERMRKGAIVSSSSQGMTSWRIKIRFFQAFRRERRDSGEREERELRKGAERGLS